VSTAHELVKFLDLARPFLGHGHRQSGLVEQAEPLVPFDQIVAA